MKFLFTLLICSVLLFGSCKNDTKSPNEDSTSVVKVDTIIKKDNSTKEDQQDISQKKEFTSKYICPMHCKGSGDNKPGTCPECGMEYIENPDY